MRNSTSTISIPNPTPLLYVMAAAMAWYVWGEDADAIRTVAACIVLGLLIAGVAYLLSRRALLAVIGLIAAGAMSRLYFLVFGMKVRPEHLAVVFCCLAVPFWPRQKLQRTQWMLPDLLLVFYVASNLLSSLVMSIAPAKTLRWAMQQALVILPYFLLRMFCTDRDRFRKAFNILLIVGAVQAAIGVLCFFSNLAFGSEFGMEIGQYGDIPGTYGLNFEANILGAISAAAFVIMLIMYLKERRPILLWGTAITYAGVVIALARAAILAAILALALLIVVAIKIKLADRGGVKKLAQVILITSLVLLPVMMPLYLERFKTLDVSGVSDISDMSEFDSNTATRIIVIASAMDGIMAHPILGNGTASFQLLVTNEDMGFGDDDAGTWIGNTEMRVLHDTGLVGLGLLLWFMGALALRSWKILKDGSRPELLALLFACVVYAVSFQATEGTLLEFFWVHMGLIGCAVSLYQRPETESAGFVTGQNPSGAPA
jgi:hypothetical protein